MGEEKFKRPVLAPGFEFDQVQNASTASNIANFGAWRLSNSTAGGSRNYTMDAPDEGRMVALMCETVSTSTGTDNVTVTLASGTFDGSNNLATFDAAGDGLLVVGISTTRYGIAAINSVTFSTG